MVFKCEMDTENGKEVWEGIIPRFTKCKSHYEIRIEARSGIMVVFGKSSRGNWACIPDFGAGCYLSNFEDKFWNSEQLTRVLGPVDGITVASALYALANKI